MDRYNEVRRKFRAVRSKYSGWFRRHSGNMDEADKKTLADCVGVLLPLETTKTVQEEIAHSIRTKGTLHYKIAELNWKIVDYLTNFQNTGVRRVLGGLLD